MLLFFKLGSRLITRFFLFVLFFGVAGDNDPDYILRSGLSAPPPVQQLEVRIYSPLLLFWLSYKSRAFFLLSYSLFLTP